MATATPDTTWSTQRSDRPRAERGVTALYACLNLAPPTFLWVDSPKAATALIKEWTGRTVTLTGLDGSLDAYWVSLFAIVGRISALGAGDRAHLDAWRDVAESTGPCYPYTKICIMTERPTAALRDEHGLLHCENAPALQYLDGFCAYALHGVLVPESAVMAPRGVAPKARTAKEIRDLYSGQIQRVIAATLAP